MNNLFTKQRERFDMNQRLFLAGKLHSTRFNEWFSSCQQEWADAVWEEINWMKENPGASKDTKNIKGRLPIPKEQKEIIKGYIYALSDIQTFIREEK